MNVDAIQQFATDLRKTVSGKITLNILGAVFTIVEYAGKCGMRVAKVSFADLQLGSIASEKPVAFFTREQAKRIIEEAREPFKTLFNLAWLTGLRAGEILALTLDDLNFDRKTIRVNKASDDLTREIRQPKTKGSVAHSTNAVRAGRRVAELYSKVLEAKPKRPSIRVIARRWKAAYTKERSGERAQASSEKARHPEREHGLHAFRHGLATELVDNSVPLTVLQNQLRHADVRTTLKIYAHLIPQSQRDAMEKIGGLQSLLSTNTLLKFASKYAVKREMVGPWGLEPQTSTVSTCQG